MHDFPNLCEDNLTFLSPYLIFTASALLRRTASFCIGVPIDDCSLLFWASDEAAAFATDSMAALISTASH